MLSYNIKIQEFYNGEIKFSIYPDGINQVFDEEKSYVDNQRVESSLERSINECVYNPFTEKVERLREFEDVVIELQRAENNNRRSLRRTKNKINDLARSEKWEYFFTLTYDSAKTDRYDFSECLKKCRQWLNNQHKRYSPDLSYLFVPEQHADGAWHMHGVVANCGSIKFVDSGHKTKTGQTVYNVGGWRFGFSTATKVSDTYKVTNYITKYITKELCQVTKGKNRYIASNNLHEPVENVILSFPENCENIEDFLIKQCEEIAVNHGYQFKNQTRINGYKKAIYQIYQFNTESEEKNE